MRDLAWNGVQRHSERSVVILEGYETYTRRSPLTDPWGPLFLRETEASVQLAVEIREPHCNSRGFAHGGFIASLADTVMGICAVRQARKGLDDDRATAVTASLNLDFIDSVRLGECVEFVPTVLNLGRTLSVVECRVVCGSRIVARGNATFRMVRPV